jgi:transposase InsO family protein
VCEVFKRPRGFFLGLPLLANAAGKELRVARRRYSDHFRQVAVERMRGCESIVALKSPAAWQRPHGAGNRSTKTSGGSGPSFRSWRAIRQRGVRSGPRKHGMIPSMSRPANPYDNASCDSFLKTLKREEIYANQYNDLVTLRTHIEEFIDQYYNRQRLHSALGKE